MHNSFLFTLGIYLAAAVIAVPLFKRFGLASVLGYLAAGSIIGPSGFGFIKDVESTMSFSEFGVVLLLFIIGLELKPSRLWTLRKSVFGIGGLQVALTALPLAGLALALGATGITLPIVGLTLAFSSTAFALQIMSEKRELGTKHGRLAFSILLFQDLAAIPLLAIVPLLASQPNTADAGFLIPALKVTGMIAAVVIGGRYLLRPALRLVASSRTNEIFTAAALLIVVSTALLMSQIGLSMALGSFLAGILLADSEYRHELEADIEPFKGLLLGLFFMAIGMTVDYTLITHAPLKIIGGTLALLAIKGSAIFAVGRIGGLKSENARTLAVTLPQGGEFAFVIFAVAVTSQVLSAELAAQLVVIVTLSMALTPLLVLLNEKYFRTIFAEEKVFDQIDEGDNPVIIAGFGRVGQIAGRVLRVLDIGFTALDHDQNQVDVLRKFGNKIYFGDASKIELLKAAGADKAKVFILAIDDVDASVKTAEVVKHHFPNLKIFARARNRQHAYRLLDLGIDKQWRETLGSSIEMTESVLQEFGFTYYKAQRVMDKFRSYDERGLLEQHRVHHDESQLVQLSTQYAQQLADVMQIDRVELQDLRRERNT
jgi:monovalent cation:proton antiporter-2 (CPA2) family protein